MEACFFKLLLFIWLDAEEEGHVPDVAEFEVEGDEENPRVSLKESI